MKIYGKVIKILLVTMVVIGVLVAIFNITGVYDPDNTLFGNNANATGYGRGGFSEKEFQTIEEAMKEVNKEKERDDNDMTLLYEATTENLTKVFSR